MKRMSQFFFALVLFSKILTAQQSPITRCGTPVPDESWNNWFNQKVVEFKEQQEIQRLNEPTGIQTATYTIPVIVHVIHGGQTTGTYPNISQGQINSQIQVLNADFAGTGYNVGNVPAIFSSLVANTGIEFVMALRDTNGNTLSEPGIERINYSSMGWTDPTTLGSNISSYLQSTIKPQSIWDPTKYFNIWICDLSSPSILEYGTWPAASGLVGLGSVGTDTTDGVWVYSKVFGSQTIFPGGTYLAPFNRGRSATHSIGHWLGLRHIGGDGTCATDYCTDTPTQKGGFSGGPSGQNYGCPTHPYVASGECAGTTAEMFMNFMDYTDDACMYMFTPDQVMRMEAAMINGTYRKFLGTHGLQSPLQIPVAAFTSLNDTVCSLNQTQLTDQSTNYPSAWQWSSIPSATFSATNTQNPIVSFPSAGSYTVSLVVNNPAGGDTIDQVIVALPTPILATIPDSQTYCHGDIRPVEIFSSNPMGAAISWTNSNITIGFGSSGTDSIPGFITTNVAVAQNTGIVSVSVSGNNGCTSVTSYSINVNTLPIITNAIDMFVCKGEIISALSFSTIPSGATITWTNNNSNIGLGLNGSSSLPSFIAAGLSNPEIGTIICSPSLNGCNGPLASFSITVISNCVWPGDANSDGLADNNDILELGLHYGSLGGARATVSNNWYAFDSPVWGTDTVSTGYNLKHADCNGDGTINSDDTLAINLNYGLTHTLRLADINKTNTTGDIYFGSAQLGYGAGQQVAVDVYLGESTNPLQNFYGAAFTIDYNDNTLVQPGSLSFSIDDASWVGIINTDAIRLTKPMEGIETIDAAICKTNHINTSGSGKIGTLRFIASNTIGNFSVTASNAYYIDNAAIQTPLTSATYTVNINTAVGLQNQTSNSNISIYPNPNNGSFTLSNLNTREEYNLEVKDVLGRTVYTDVIKSNSSNANIKLNQAAGVYWLQISSKQGGAEVHKVVVE